MRTNTQGAQSGPGSVSGLLGRLRERRPEIEQTLLARVYSVSDPNEAGDPDYVAGLRAAVSAALDYALAGIDGPKQGDVPIPDELPAQARQAVRNGVSLDTVLRRYFAGYTLLGDFIVQDTGGSDCLDTADLQWLLRTLSNLFDRLIVAVAQVYTREVDEMRLRSTKERRVEQVRRLLAGLTIDTEGLGYDFAAHHLGLVAAGPGAGEAIREIAATLDRLLLLVDPGEQTVWAWLGGRERLPPEEMKGIAIAVNSPVTVAIGEPAQGLAGWRLTHLQAGAALPIATEGAERVVRYADVALLASALRDDVLASSLESMYLEPLAVEPDGGAALRDTLRAYFAAGRHVSSTSNALRVSRQTVNRRLRSVEAKVGRPLDECAADIETALRFAELANRRTVRAH